MINIVAKKINVTDKANIDTPVNKFIKDNALSPSEISSIHFNSDLSAAVIIYHCDSDKQVIVEEASE